MKINYPGRRLVRPFICAPLLLCVALVASPFAAGQNGADTSEPAKKSDGKKVDLRKSYSLIFGTVWTADNHPAYGVTVKIRRADQKKPKWELTSDHNGEFAQRLPPGPADYVITAELPEQKKPAAETKIHVEGQERVDVGLHLTK